MMRTITGPLAEIQPQTATPFLFISRICIFFFFLIFYSNIAPAQINCEAVTNPSAISGRYGNLNAEVQPATSCYAGNAVESAYRDQPAGDARTPFAMQLPDTNGPIDVNSPTLARWVGAAGVVTSGITASCPGGIVSILSNGLITISLDINQQCAFSTSANAGPGNDLMRYSGGTLRRDAGGYSITAGTISGGAFGPAVRVTTTSLPTATFGVSYTSAALTASGGTSPYSFVATGLPTGLTLHPSTGVISGTPSQAGTFTINVTATDGGGVASEIRTLTLAVAAADMALDLTGLPTTAAIGTPYSGTLRCLNSASATAPAVGATCTLNGLPTGLNIGTCSPSVPTTLAAGGSITCPVTGVPTSLNTAHATAATSAVNDPILGNNTATITISVNSVPSLTLSVATSQASFNAIGQIVIYTYTVSNTGSVPLVALAVSDTRVSQIICSATTLSVATSITCTGKLIVSAADIAAKVITSTATATGEFGGIRLSATAAATTLRIDEDAVRRITSSAIQSFMMNRARLISGNETDATRRHGRLQTSLFGGSPYTSPTLYSAAIADSGQDMPSSMTTWGNAPIGADGGRLGLAGPGPATRSSERLTISGAQDNGVGRLNFATSLTKLRMAAATELAQKEDGVTDVPMGLGLSSRKLSAVAPLPFDFWAEGTVAYFSNDRPDGNRQGHAGILSIGADYLVMRGVLVGATLQLDSVEQSSSRISGNGSGRGWMAGPYISTRLTSNVLFDARALWGRSTNDIDPLGAYSDVFSTSRSLVDAKLTGQWEFGALTFKPSLQYTSFNEQQQAYTNAIGIPIDAQSVHISQLRFGPELTYRMAFHGLRGFEPFLGLKGVREFSKTSELTAFGDPVSAPPLHARLEGGATLRHPSGITMRARGVYEGLGGDSFKSWRGQGTVVIPLN